jgi:hypothetical protein
LATLSHVLLECPTAAAAWQWFLRLWQAVEPGAEPDVTSSRIVLLDDSSVWAPSARKRQLWTLLRLQMLECLFIQATQRQRQQQQQQQVEEEQSQQQQQQQEQPLDQQHEQPLDQQPLDQQPLDQQEQQAAANRAARAAVCSFRAAVQAMIRSDRTRMCGDVRWAAGVPLSWLPGKSPLLDAETFDNKWGVLAVSDAVWQVDF